MSNLTDSFDLTRIDVRVMLITPEMAQEFLTRNISNRRLDEKTVALYARLLREGHFMLSNDAICFSRQDILLNGQHRLTACCKTGKPMYCIVCRGMPSESYIIMDNGKNRSAADILSVQANVKNATLTAATIKRFKVLERGNVAIVPNKMAGLEKMSNAEIEEEYTRHPKFWEDICTWAKRMCAQSRWKLLSASEVAGTSAYLIRIKAHDINIVKNFFEEIEGIQTPTNSSISAFQVRLNDGKRNPTKRPTALAAQKMLVKTWNAYLTGKTYQFMHFDPRYDKDRQFI